MLDNMVVRLTFVLLRYLLTTSLCSQSCNLGSLSAAATVLHLRFVSLVWLSSSQYILTGQTNFIKAGAYRLSTTLAATVAWSHTCMLTYSFNFWLLWRTLQYPAQCPKWSIHLQARTWVQYTSSPMRELLMRSIFRSGWSCFAFTWYSLYLMIKLTI